VTRSAETTIPIFQVDAFTDELFKGNPAAVCLLSQQYEDRVLQSIAAEMNLSETAFLLPLEQKPLAELKAFSLRWFTPRVEVPLCGHATLAAARVLFSEIAIQAHEATFMTKSGKLVARRDKGQIVLDFPRERPVPTQPPQGLLGALGISEFEQTLYAERNKMLLVHLSRQSDLVGLKPDFELVKSVSADGTIMGIIVTSQGEAPCDFVSRFFAPWVGIDEDPVTGAAHTVLAPYWSGILGKREMVAHQASSRGGKVGVRLTGDDRVDLIGSAVIVLKGEFYL